MKTKEKRPSRPGGALRLIGQLVFHSGTASRTTRSEDQLIITEYVKLKILRQRVKAEAQSPPTTAGYGKIYAIESAVDGRQYLSLSQSCLQHSRDKHLARWHLQILSVVRPVDCFCLWLVALFIPKRMEFIVWEE